MAHAGRSVGQVGTRKRVSGEARSLRAQNLEEVLGLVMNRKDAFTRAEVVRATGLSAPTVGSLLTDLEKRGLVRDLGPGPSSGGRRPSCMEFDARCGFVAGIDLGVATTRLAVADLWGERVAVRVLRTPTGMRPRDLVAWSTKALGDLTREAHVPQGRLLAVGAAVPGAVDRESGEVTLAPNLAGWSRVPMRRLAEDALDAPLVVENDVNLAVLGERWKGAARGHDTCAYVSLGSGIGAGVVVNGQLHRGQHCLAGEIGLMCMGPQYLDRDYGTRGCLETLAGQDALASRWAKGRDPDRWLPELFAAAERGQRDARRAVDETVRLVGMALTNLSLILDPSLIVLGGSLPANGPLLVRELRRMVQERVPKPAELVPSALGEEAALWGSLLIAHDHARERLRQTLCPQVGRAARAAGA